MPNYKQENDAVFTYNYKFVAVSYFMCECHFIQLLNKHPIFHNLLLHIALPQIAFDITSRQRTLLHTFRMNILGIRTCKPQRLSLAWKAGCERAYLSENTTLYERFSWQSGGHSLTSLLLVHTLGAVITYIEQSFTQLLTHSSTQSVTQSLIHSLTKSPTQLDTRSFIH